MPGSINEQRTKLTMNYLTILPIYTIGIFADYSRPQSASDEKPATSEKQKMSNEPNSKPFSPATTWRGCLAPTPAVDVFYLIAVAITKNCQTNPISAKINVTSVMMLTKDYQIGTELQPKRPTTDEPFNQSKITKRLPL